MVSNNKYYTARVVSGHIQVRLIYKKKNYRYINIYLHSLFKKRRKKSHYFFLHFVNHFYINILKVINILVIQKSFILLV